MFKEKFNLLADILKKSDIEKVRDDTSETTFQSQAMVFFNFKMQGEELAKDLKRIHGIQSVFIHGD